MAAKSLPTDRGCVRQIDVAKAANPARLLKLGLEERRWWLSTVGMGGDDGGGVHLRLDRARGGAGRGGELAREGATRTGAVVEGRMTRAGGVEEVIGGWDGGGQRRGWDGREKEVWVGERKIWEEVAAARS